MLHNIKIDIAYIVEKQYLCSRIINPLIITIMTKKLTKNDSMCNTAQANDEREIINYTKPFKEKSCFVCISYDYSEQIYELRGIDVYGCPIKKEHIDYNSAAHDFYYELCWMLNDDIMYRTSEQRKAPQEAYLNK